MTEVADRMAKHGVRSMVGFNYRRVPALALARELVAEGRLGEIRHVRAQYLQDWIVDPAFPLVWRLQTGQGRVGCVGGHRGAHHRPGAVRHRPADHGGVGPDGDVHQGAPAGRGIERPERIGRQRRRSRSRSTTLLCSWPASPAERSAASRRPGSPPDARTHLRIEVNGSLGSVAFDFETMNELAFYDGTEDARDCRVPPHLVTEPDAPVRRRVVATRPRPRLRALVHPRGRRPRAATSPPAATRAVVRGRPAGAAGPRRGGGLGRADGGTSGTQIIDGGTA